MELTFTGGKELAAALRKLPELVATEVLETAVVAGAGILREAAALRAPRPGIRRRTGIRLADSIKVTVTEKTRSAVTVNVGTKVPYAHLVEFGHQIVPRGPGRAVSAARANRRKVSRSASGFVPARPFMRPAFDENREAIIQRIGQVMGKGIEVEARKVAGPLPTVSA